MKLIKNIFFSNILIVLLLTICSCQSNEDKAAKVIREEFYKTLYDFESYSPIETIVTEAKQSIYTDTATWAKLNILAIYYKTTKNAKDEAEEALKNVEQAIRWFKIIKSKENKEELEEARDNLNEKMKAFEIAAEKTELYYKEAKEIAQLIDSTKTVGWEVKHRFRCKSKGGHALLEEYRFVLSEDFKKILIGERIGSEEYKETRAAIYCFEDNVFEGFKKKFGF